MTLSFSSDQYSHNMEHHDDDDEYYARVSLTKEQGKTAGGLTKLKEKNWGMIKAETEVTRLLTLIMTSSNDEVLIREAYKFYEFPLKYKAVEGVYKNKKGVESKCWNSIWGKYAGSQIINKEPPLLTFYVPYKAEDFDFVADGTYKFKYNKPTATKHGVTVTIV